MKKQTKKSTDVRSVPIFTVGNRSHTGEVIIYSSDLHQPWKSVYGFPTLAARLAAGQVLVLICREDELLQLMEKLNSLLNSSSSLNQAFEMLKNLEQETLKKVARSIARQTQPITDAELAELIAWLEEYLNERPEQTLAGRLDSILSPVDPAQEVTGLRKMLIRLQRLTLALAQVKEEGFKVVVGYGQPQPMRPAQAVCSDQLTTSTRIVSEPTVDFLQPVSTHLTLWRYWLGRAPIIIRPSSRIDLGYNN